MTGSIRFGNGSSFDGDVETDKDLGTFIAPSIAFHQHTIDDQDAAIFCENGNKLIVHTGKALYPISMQDPRTSIPFQILSIVEEDGEDNYEGIPFFSP